MQLQIHKLHEAIVEPLIMKVLKNDIFFLLLFVIFCLEKKNILLQKFISPPKLV